jgi:hypothetical protein
MIAAGRVITLDVNAAGWGWFVDLTPWEDSEFLLLGNQAEQGRMDLLTVLVHELGHVLGFEHEEGAMAETLDAGVRQVPNNKPTIDLPPTDLPNALSLAWGNTIWFDANVARWNWFIKLTPWENSEFYRSTNRGERNRMDGLTVLAHEVGPLLGYEHAEDGSLMAETRTPAIPDWRAGVDLLFSEPVRTKRRT